MKNKTMRRIALKLGLHLAPALVVFLLAFPAMAGQKFDRVYEVFQGAAPILPSEFTGESAWAGYCVHASDKVDEVDDAMIAFRYQDDPVMGSSLRSLHQQNLGSSNFYLRMDEKAARAEIDKVDSSSWNVGFWNDGELYSQASLRHETIVRKAFSPGVYPEIDGAYYVAAKRCRSLDGVKCNASSPQGFIVYEACYFYSRKF